MTNTDLATPSIGEEAAAAIAAALIEGALPGETNNFDEHARTEAAAFMAEVAAVTPPWRSGNCDRIDRRRECPAAHAAGYRQ